MKTCSHRGTARKTAALFLAVFFMHNTAWAEDSSDTTTSVKPLLNAPPAVKSLTNKTAPGTLEEEKQKTIRELATPPGTAIDSTTIDRNKAVEQPEFAPGMKLRKDFDYKQPGVRPGLQPGRQGIDARTGKVITPRTGNDIRHTPLPSGPAFEAGKDNTAEQPGFAPGVKPREDFDYKQPGVEPGLSGSTGQPDSRNQRTGTGTSDPFIRDAEGRARSTPGGFTGDDKTTGTPDPFVRDADGRATGTPGGSRPIGPKYDADKDIFIFEDGSRVRGSDPSGNRGKINDKGDVVYPDGTLVGHDPESGTTTVVRPDGSSTTHGGHDPFVRDADGRPKSSPGGFGSGGPTPDSGPAYDSNKDVFVFSDGTRVRGSDPSGNRGKVNEKGDIEYSDGTMVSHDSARGSTTTMHPDGTSTVHDHRSGVTISFGARDSTYEKGASKDDDAGSSSSGSSGNDSSGNDSGSSAGSDTGSDSDTDSGGSDDNDDDSDDDSSSSESDSDDSESADSSDEDSSDSGDDGGDEYTGDGSRSGGFSDGPTDVITRRLENMRDGRRDEANGNDSDCGPTSQPGPDGHCAESTGPAQPAAENPGVTNPVVSTGAAAGTSPVDPGDCFDPAGCDQGLNQTFNPFDRMPVVNPVPD